jgi:hypothetical protein
MTSQAIRDPLADHLIPPPAELRISADQPQPTQISTVRLMDQDLLLGNAVSTVRLAKTYDAPIDRTTMNSWEETVQAFVEIVLTDRLLEESAEAGAAA